MNRDTHKHLNLEHGTLHKNLLFAAYLPRHSGNSVRCRHGLIFEHRRERHRHVHRAHALYRRIEIIKRAVSNHRRHLSRHAVLLIAFIDSPITSLYVLGLYVGVQIIESNVITPLIERETVELPPALTVVFQLGLGALVGGLGLVLATPLLAVIVVVVQLVYIQDILGDKEDGLAALEPEVAD